MLASLDSVPSAVRAYKMTVPPSVSPKPAATATTVTSRVSTYMSSDDAELGDLCGCERCGADSDSDEIITFMTLTLCRACE